MSQETDENDEGYFTHLQDVPFREWVELKMGEERSDKKEKIPMRQLLESRNQRPIRSFIETGTPYRE